MSELSPGTSPSASASEERLDSWKEIAAYLNRDVTTVQRWEKREGMPVRRHLHDRMGSVYASRAELDSWARSRNLRAAQKNVNPVLSSDQPGPVSPVATLTSPTNGKVISMMAAGVGLILAIGVIVWLQKRDYFWRSPIAAARIQTVTNFDGMEQEAAVSRDGQFVAFLSDRDGPMDVWVTQVASGEFHNLTRGSAPEMANPAVRTLGFSPDGSFVTFWARQPNSANGKGISVWAVPTLGGQARPYLTGAAEFDWSGDASRLVYHTSGPGDPLFVSDRRGTSAGKLIFTAPAGLHAHFPLWSPDLSYIYFVQGALPINWISGAYLPVAELRNGSLLTTLV